MKKTAWLNQKGGVGKSGGAAGTAGALIERGRRVLLVDLDPQGHLTTEALQLDDQPSGHSVPNLANALTTDYEGPIANLLVHHSSHPSGGQLWVLPTSLDMFKVVRTLYARVQRMEERLSLLLSDLCDELAPEHQPDHVLIDCPPALDVLTDNALVATDGLLIPVEPDKTSLRALRLLMGQLAASERGLRLTRRTIHGLVPSVYRKPLSSLDRYVMGQLEALDSEGLPVVAQLPLATRVKEAWLAGTPITLHDPSAPISEQYRRLAVLLDVAAGLSQSVEWDELGEVPSASQQRAETGVPA